MDIESVFIKSEPQDECSNSSDTFQHDISQNYTDLVNPIKIEVKSEIGELSKSSDTEEMHETTTNNICKDEPEYFFTSNETDIGWSKINVDEFSNKNNQVDMLKMELLTQNENSWYNIKQEEVDCGINKESDNENDSGCSKIKVDSSNDVNKMDTNVNSIPSKQKSIKVSCQFCDKLIVTRRSLDNHMLKQHLKEIEGNIKDFIIYKIYSCNLCAYQTTYKAKLDTHVNSLHNEQRVKKFSCKLCDKFFVLKGSLDNHVLKQHQNEINTDVKGLITSKIHTCQFCSYQSTHKTQFDRHMDSFHNQQRSKKFICQFCIKSFVTKQSLDNHMLQEHQKEIKNNINDFISYKTHACNFCIYQTTYKNKLDTHVTSMHNEETSQKPCCQFCDKAYVLKQSLDDHMLKQHLNEIKSDIKNFITHKIHMCNVCSYQTTYRAKLDIHVSSTHSEQVSKKFSCQFCDKLFVTKQSLDNHQLKTHKGKIKDNMMDFISSKIHICNSCSYQTPIKSNLVRHVNTMHNE